MAYTTVPTIVITLIVFIILGFSIETQGEANISQMLTDIEASVNVTPWLFLVPAVVIFLIVKKTPPTFALLIGTLLAAVFALIFQPEIVASIAGVETLTVESAYKGLMQAITVDSSVPTESVLLADLFSSGGMAGMLGTSWLIICAMVFGGVMEAIGALAAISRALLNAFDSVFGLFASTVGSCIILNTTASDQYLAIVVPGKMYAKAYKDKGLAPENLSRTLEDSGTVTSVLIPWNTCGAYQSGTLGVSVQDYFVYAIFNYLSPVMTLIFAALNIKIKRLADKITTAQA
jgi:NhaC family Na+:H+ antiporter